MNFSTGLMKISPCQASPVPRVSTTQLWSLAIIVGVRVSWVMGNVLCTLFTGVMTSGRYIIKTPERGPLTPHFVHTIPFGKTWAAITNQFLDWGARVPLSIATIPRAHLLIGTPQPAETIQTEYSRWGSPAQTQTTFARRAVTLTHGVLDAQPAAKTQLTSNVHNPINAFIPVYIVIVTVNVIWEKMRIWMNVYF